MLWPEAVSRAGDGFAGGHFSCTPHKQGLCGAPAERAIICISMSRLRVQIVRFVDAYQPGIVECQFRDAAGKTHSIIGKLPCFTCANLWSDSEYPQPGEVDCCVLGSPEHEAVTIRLAEETTNGIAEVVVPEADLIS